MASVDTNVQCTNYTSLPPEIWLLIFPDLQPQDLRSVSLTCSSFRYFAQPLLFCVLDVSPFHLSYNVDKPISRPRTYLGQFLKRLEFYQLPRIAHAVRHCWISPYCRSGYPTRNRLDDLEPNLIINALLQALPLFPNLSSFSWHCTDFTPEWWAMLSSLRIKKIWLNSCSIAPKNDALLLPLPYVTHLDLDRWPWEGRPTNHVAIQEDRMDGVSLEVLQNVIHPQVTQSISVPRLNTAHHLFSILSAQIHQLRSLHIPFFSLQDVNFTVGILNCPQLESLSFFPPPSDEWYVNIELDALAPDALPFLSSYEGPYTHVLQFSNQPLRQIMLWGLDERPSFCDPECLAVKLKELATTRTVKSLTSLQVAVSRTTHDLLEVFSGFGQLERLTIQSQDNHSRNLSETQSDLSTPIVMLLFEMTSQISLPPTLKFLKLSTRLSSPKLDLCDQEHEAACFTEALARKNAHLKRLEIAYGIYWTGLYNAVWERMRENVELEGDDMANPGSHDTAITKGEFTSKSGSRDYIQSTVVSSVHILPLGALTFTEHRRTILFHNPNGPVEVNRRDQRQGNGERGDHNIWMSVWTKLRRWLRRR